MGTSRTASRQPTSGSHLRHELREVVERITYQNPDNGSTVAGLAAERRDAEGGRSSGDVRLVTLPATLQGMKCYLGSGLVRCQQTRECPWVDRQRAPGFAAWRLQMTDDGISDRGRNLPADQPWRGAG